MLLELITAILTSPLIPMIPILKMVRTLTSTIMVPKRIKEGVRTIMDYFRARLLVILSHLLWLGASSIIKRLLLPKLRIKLFKKHL